MSLQKRKEKIVKFPKRKILKFPNNPEEVKELLALEEYLVESLSREETFSERVETRKQLKTVREAIREKISG